MYALIGTTNKDCIPFFLKAMAKRTRDKGYEPSPGVVEETDELIDGEQAYRIVMTGEKHGPTTEKERRTLNGSHS